MCRSLSGQGLSSVPNCKRGQCVAGVVGAIAGIHIALTGMIGKAALIDNLKASCFACASSCKDVQFDNAGKAKCLKCESDLHRGQWAEPMQLPISAMLRGAGLAVGVAALLLATVFLSLFGLTLLHAKIDWVRQLNHAWQSWPDDMRITIDLTVIALIIASSVRIYRSRQARFYDRQDKFCRSCDHDLQGTPIEQGIGRCPECGVPFARYSTAEE